MVHASTTVMYYYAFVDAVFNPALEQLDNLETTLKTIEVVADPKIDDDSLTVVYVIGESFDRHRSNLYGYPLNTNPNLSRYRDNGNLVAFSNVVAPYNRTIELIAPLLSLHDVESKTEFGKAPLIPAVFKKAGYRVAYYDNQSVVSTKDMDFGCTYFFSRKAIVEACTDTLNDASHTFDGDFVRNYPPDVFGSKSLIIYHLMGQHVAFSQRYTSDFAFFAPEDYKSIYPYSDNEMRQVVDYDNATRYHDAVIEAIIERLKDRDAVLVYVPDHGEECHDFRSFVGRELNLTHIGTVKAVLEVPAVIWMSDKFISSRKPLVDSLRSNVDKPIYNVDLPHTLLELAGLSTSGFNPGLSLLRNGDGRQDRVVMREFYYDRRRREVDAVRFRYEK